MSRRTSREFLPAWCTHILAVIVLDCCLLVLGSESPHVARAESGPVLVTLRNGSSDVAIRCAIYLAHWFSHDLGRLDPGQRTEFAVNIHGRMKLVTLRNDAGADMAVEGIYCNVVGSQGQLATWMSADALRVDNGCVAFVCQPGHYFRCDRIVPDL